MPFRFMDLPVELRLVVYEALLSSRNGVISLSSYAPPKRIRCSFDTAILRASKTIYSEALPILYGSNSFVVRAYHWEMLNTNYTKCMGLSNAALIRWVLCEAHVERMQEVEVKQAFEAMGIQWERLCLLGIKLGTGLGKFCGPEACREQNWLKEVQSKKEGKSLGLREWGPLKPNWWFIKKEGELQSQPSVY